MKKPILLISLLVAVLTAAAQGNNTRMGGDDGDYQSLAERVAKIEKKNDMFNVYFNYAASAQLKDDGEKWTSGFANKDLRFEIKGNLTDKIFYRLRHRLNRSNAAKGEDNFAKATDFMMVGYHLNDKLTFLGGKMGQIWGGYEYDENPMYIYQYSDLLDHMDIFHTGFVASYKPVPTQEIALEVCDASNGKLEEDYGGYVVTFGESFKPLEQANHPLTFIANWNGSFFGDKLQTRWAWGIQTLAKGTYSRELTLGQRLNLPKLQWYLDYVACFDDMDRLGIATADLVSFYRADFDYFYSNRFYYPNSTLRCGKVHYYSFTTKLNWQFAPHWNLMVKSSFVNASKKNAEMFKNYRRSLSGIASLEYYPDKTQDLRVFLAYLGQKVDYTEKSTLTDYNTNRFELGFMYRIKCY